MILGADMDENSTYENILSADGRFESYSGSLKPALLTQANTLSFINVLYPTVDVENVPYTQTSASKPGDLNGLLKHHKAIAQATVSQAPPAPGAAAYGFKHCTYSGTARQSKSAATTYQFNDCQQQQNLVLNGTVAINDQSADTTPNQYTLTFNNLNVHDNSKHLQYSGSIEVLQSKDAVITTANLERNDSAGNKHYFRNISWSDGEYDQLTGRIYDAENGYVELHSSEDLKLDQDGIPTQGHLYLRGSDYAKASVGKARNIRYGSVHIELDEYGDGFNEIHITKNVIYTRQPVFYALDNLLNRTDSSRAKPHNPLKQHGG